MPRPRDAVDEAVGASTRRASERRQFRDGVRATQAHPALDHQHYKNLAEKNYKQYTHDALLPTAPAQPGLVMWGRKRGQRRWTRPRKSRNVESQKRLRRLSQS